MYPGSFDPLTYGHLDIIQRGAAIFDKVIVAILKNAGKEPLFSSAERIAMIEEAVGAGGRVKVDVFDGLLVDYVERMNASVILRGVRAVSDFEFEFQMALMNRRLNSRIETIFMMPSEAYSFVSSRLVKEVGALGGNLSGVVPPHVERSLSARFREARTR